VSSLAPSASVITAIALTASANPVVTGQRVSLTAAVTPVPDGGTVRFVLDGRTVAGCKAVAVNRSTGHAACVTRFARAGALKLQAVFSGGTNFAAASSSTLTESVRWSLILNRSPRAVSGVVTSTLGCAVRSGGCAVRIVVIVGSAGGAAGNRRLEQPVAVGEKMRTIPAGHAVTMAIRLSTAGRAQLTQRKRLSGEQTVSLIIAGERVLVTTTRFTFET
jgi:hypothetical protein